MSNLFVFDIDNTVGIMPENTCDSNLELDQFWFEDFYGRGQLFYIRPYFLDFLKKSVQEMFDVAVWSAADSYYVEQIVKGIDNLLIEQDFQIKWKFVWNISSCNQDNYIKDLSKIVSYFPEYHRPENITFFDDCAEHIKYNLPHGFNCVLVPKYKSDNQDLFFKYLSNSMIFRKN